MVPLIVSVLIVSAAGLGLGWPTGKILHRSGATKLLPRSLLAIVSAIFIIIFGEAIHTGFLVFMTTGKWDVSLILHAVLPLAVGDDLNFAVYKFLFAAAVAVAIYETAKTNALKLRI